MIANWVTRRSAKHTNSVLRDQPIDARITPKRQANRLPDLRSARNTRPLRARGRVVADQGRAAGRIREASAQPVPIVRCATRATLGRAARLTAARTEPRHAVRRKRCIAPQAAVAAFHSFRTVEQNVAIVLSGEARVWPVAAHLSQPATRFALATDNVAAHRLIAVPRFDLRIGRAARQTRSIAKREACARPDDIHRREPVVCRRPVDRRNGCKSRQHVLPSLGFRADYRS